MTFAAVVRATLTAARVLEVYGVRYARRGGELRTRQCPGCGVRSSESVAVDASSGVWFCHRAGCHGDLFALVAGFAGLDVKREFSRVLERAAEIAGFADGGGNTEAIERMLAERQRAEAAEQRQRAEHVARMPSVWAELATRSEVGERYLAARGIDPDTLRVRGLARYSASGEIAVPMRALADGAIVGVQYRAPRGKSFRCEPGSLADGAALVGRVAELDGGGVDIAVLCEGLADTLAACLAWPSCAVFGAAGKAHMPAIAAAVAPRIAEVRGGLLVVPDNDDGGAEAAARACKVATAAGLALDLELRIVDLGEHHDLADAWRTGRRPEELAT